MLCCGEGPAAQRRLGAAETRTHMHRPGRCGVPLGACHRSDRPLRRPPSGDRSDGGGVVRVLRVVESFRAGAAPHLRLLASAMSPGCGRLPSQVTLLL